MLFGELGCVPAAAEGADELDGGGELAGVEVGGGALVGEQGALGGEDFEVAGGSALIALVGDVEGVLGGGDGVALGGGLLLEDAEVGELVFDFVECAEDGGFVGGGLGLVAVAGFAGEGVAAAGVKEELGGLCAEGPEGAGALNPCGGLEALEAAGCAEGDGGVIGADGDADLGVGGGDAALGGGDVGAALYQLRRKAEGDGGEREGEGRGGEGEVAGLEVGEGGQGVLVLGAGLGYVDRLGADGFKLGAGLGDIGFSADAAVEPLLGEGELALVVGDGGLEQVALGVEAAEFEVVLSQLGVEGEVEGGEVGGAGLGGFTGGLDGAADAAPEVGLPGGLAFKLEVAVGVGLAGRVGGPVDGDGVAGDGGAGGEGGKEAGAGDADLVVGGEIGFEGGAEVLVAGGDEVFKAVELGVLVDLPPFSAEEAVGGGGGLPGAGGGGDGGCAGFFVDGGGGGSWGLRGRRR